MNENSRLSGAHDQGDPVGSSPSEQQRGPAPGTGWGGYPAPPAHHPRWSPQAWGAPRGAEAGAVSDAESGAGADAGSGASFGHLGPAAASASPAAPRARRPVALLAAVALVAAAVGGGTAYAVQELTGESASVSSSAGSPQTVNGTSVATGGKGTVAGVAAAVSPSIVEVTAATPGGKSTGSGVIVTEDGEIVTNNHVVAGASQIKVTTNDGKSYRAEVVGTDSAKDLALIKASGAPDLKPATLGDSSRLRVGQDVVAIGSPEGLSGTVTRGIVSALNRDVTVAADQEEQAPGPEDGWPFEFDGRQFNGDPGSATTTYKAIQTDAALNPGNSGGALINMDGEIIGINSAMYAPSSASGSSDSGSAGLGFAIPVNTLKADLDQLRSGGES
ncbi:trypsin-like peptidase domain-containing protein [Streptomyces sp. NA04227]|uniref:S1C family serine protease n=1 Tax=Streptomyces sp. NA04227 TaxID=2742136 RepID=UPI001591AB10|nr:trypsin-like peptidase domain-containing protein [Streptomyces sp. NA04227]QKW08169.1 trypsin-like peptidase domain-containing protein [Streptomyces sp. NA04227]